MLYGSYVRTPVGNTGTYSGFYMKCFEDGVLPIYAPKTIIHQKPHYGTSFNLGFRVESTAVQRGVIGS